MFGQLQTELGPLVIRLWQFSAALPLALAACGGGRVAPSGVQPGSSAQAAVQAFLRAVADSNISAMSSLWGTSSGPALATGKPADYEKRMVVAQLFLRGAPYKIAGESAVEGESTQRRINVEFDRGRCTKAVPFVVLRLKEGGWIVTQIDLNSAGSPGRACDPAQSQ